MEHTPQKPAIEGIIFDLDGVVIESELYFIRAEIEIFPRHGIPLTESVAAEYLGLKLDDYITLLEKRFQKSVNHAQVSAELLKEIGRLYESEIPLVEHVADVLNELQKTFKLALATSRERHLAKLVMKRLGVAQYFQKGVYREDVMKGKPDPEVYVKAATCIDVDPAACAVIEDARSGFDAGKAAGMFVVARKAKHNKAQDFSSADTVIEDMREIPRILRALL